MLKLKKFKILYIQLLFKIKKYALILFNKYIKNNIFIKQN